MAGTLTSQFRVFCAGDSTTLGFGAGTLDSGGQVGCRNFSYPKYLTDHLVSSGVRASYDNFFGDGAVDVSDSRVALVGSAARTGVISLGYKSIALSAPTDGVTFTPGSTNVYDSVTVMVVDISAGASFTIQVDDQAAQTSQVFTGTGNLVTQTFTFTSGAFNKITLSNVGSVLIHICGMLCENSTSPFMSICNIGMGANTTAQIIGPSDSFGPSEAIKTMKPDLLLVNTGINDIYDNSSAGTNGPAVISAVSSTVSAIVADGINIIFAMLQPFRSDYYVSGIASFLSALEPLAEQENFGIVDLSAAYNYDQAGLNAAGLYFNDLHPYAVLYSDIARIWAKVIAPPALSGVL